jgi:hypothetical protein
MLLFQCDTENNPVRPHSIPSFGCGFEWEVAFGEDGFHTDAYFFLDPNQGGQVGFRKRFFDGDDARNLNFGALF